MTWQDDPKGDILIKALLVLSLVLLGLAFQFHDATADAYLKVGTLTIIGYLGARVAPKVFVWQGLGPSRLMMSGALAGAGLYIGILVLGQVISLPLAISGGVVLNLLYRWICAVTFEEGCFRSFLFPTLTRWFNGSTLAGAVLSSSGWAYFHIVALNGDPGSVVAVTAIGFVFCMVNNQLGTNVPSYVGHGIWNLQKVLSA